MPCNFPLNDLWLLLVAFRRSKYEVHRRGELSGQGLGHCAHVFVSEFGPHEISHQTLSFGSFPALCASRKMEFFINEDCDMVMGQDRSSATTASLHLESSSSNSLVSFADSLDALSFSSISGDDSG